MTTAEAPSQTGERLLACLGRRSMTADALAREARVPPSACRAALNALVRRGRVRRFWHPSAGAPPIFRSA
ncbi:MAG: hypothetical protein KGI82_00265 [Betaproteobacteria bacterium]|nr:hypothetical protein [Betaproteobacteria bacterium]